MSFPPVLPSVGIFSWFIFFLCFGLVFLYKAKEPLFHHCMFFLDMQSNGVQTQNSGIAWV